MVFLERYERQRLLEEERFEEDARRARVLAYSLLPIGTALAVIIQYLDILVVLERAVGYDYVLKRPPIDVYFRLLGPSLLAGLLGTAIVTFAFTRIVEVTGALRHLLTIGLLYGALMPAIKGVLMPLNFFVLNIAGLSNVTGQGSLQEQLGEVLFGTHISAFLVFFFGIKESILAGLVLAALAWLLFRLAGPLTNVHRTWSIYTSSVTLALAIVFLVLAGPFPILEFLFDHYPR